MSNHSIEKLNQIKRDYKIIIHEKKEIGKLTEGVSHRLVNFYYQEYILNNKRIFILNCLNNFNAFLENINSWNSNPINPEELVENTKKVIDDQNCVISLFEYLKNNVKFVVNLLKSINIKEFGDFFSILITCVFSSFSNLEDVDFILKFIEMSLTMKIFDGRFPKKGQNEDLTMFFHILFNCTHGVVFFQKAALTAVFNQILFEKEQFFDFGYCSTSDDQKLCVKLRENETLNKILNLFNIFLVEIESSIELIPIQIEHLFCYIKSHGLFLEECKTPLLYLMWTFALMPMKFFPTQLQMNSSIEDELIKYNLKQTFFMFDQFILKSIDFGLKFGRENVDVINSLLVKMERIEVLLSNFYGNKEFFLAEYDNPVSHVFVISDNQLLQIISWIIQYQGKNKEIEEIMIKLGSIQQKLKPTKMKKIMPINKMEKNKKNILIFKKFKNSELKSMKSHLKQNNKKSNSPKGLLDVDKDSFNMPKESEARNDLFFQGNELFEVNFGAEMPKTDNFNLMDSLFLDITPANQSISPQNAIIPNQTDFISQNENNLFEFMLFSSPSIQMNERDCNKPKVVKSETGGEFNLVDLATKLTNSFQMLETRVITKNLKHLLNINSISAELQDDIQGFTQFSQSLQILCLSEKNNLCLDEQFDEISQRINQYVSFLLDKKLENIENLNFIEKLIKLNKKLNEYCDLNIISLVYNWFFEKQSYLFQGLLNDLLTCDSESQSSVISSYIDKFKPLTIQKIFKNAPEQTQLMMSTVSQQIVFGLVYSDVMFPPGSNMSDEETCRQKIACLSEDTILAPELKDINKFLWCLPQKELLMINCYKTPADKVKCVVKTIKIISSLIKMEDLSTSADTLFPALIYVICKSNPPNLMANINFVNKYSTLKEGEDNYCWTQLDMAVAYISENFIR